MEILVTGGAGFIGRAVCYEIMRNGGTAISFDRSQGLDITSPGDLGEFAGVSHVIHLAGVLGTHELFDTPQLAVDVNITGSLNVLEFCRQTGAGYTGITMPQVFPSIYTATKIASTALATAYNHTHGVPVSHVRAYNAFGPGQAHGPGHPQKIIPTFAHNIWREIPVPVWGDGNQTVDLIYTEDLARMLVDATEHGDNVTFDGGTGFAYTVNEVVDLVSLCVRADGGPTVRMVENLPMRRGEIPTDIVATGEGWERLDTLPEFRFGDLMKTVDSYQP